MSYGDKTAQKHKHAELLHITVLNMLFAGRN